MDVMLPAGWAPDKGVICRYIFIEIAARSANRPGPARHPNAEEMGG